MFRGLTSLPGAYTWIRAQRRISASHSDFLMQVDTDVTVWGWANLLGLDFGSDPKLIEFSLLDLSYTILPQQNKWRDFRVVSGTNLNPKQSCILSSCISVCYLLVYLCSVGKPRISEDLGYSITANTSTASLGLFTDSICLWSICWKKYEIRTLVSCMWYVKLWIKVPKLCISHWCVNLVKARGEQLIFVTDRYSISTCVCLAWLLSLSIVNCI